MLSQEIQLRLPRRHRRNRKTERHLTRLRQFLEQQALELEGNFLYRPRCHIYHHLQIPLPRLLWSLEKVLKDWRLPHHHRLRM